MNNYILLFSGINVGGNNIVKMKPLVSLLEQAGFSTVRSYIQSGNIVLKSESDPTDIVASIVAEHFGFTPTIMTLTEEMLNAAVANNPFQEAEGKFMHFFFCDEPIQINNDNLAKYQIASEQIKVIDKLFYLHAPEGIGRSKLVTNINRILDQASTARNLNTMNKITALVESTH